MAQSNDRMKQELNNQAINNPELYDNDDSDSSADAFTGLSENGDASHPEENDEELAAALALSMQVQAPAASDTPQTPVANAAVDAPKPAEAPKAEAPKRESPKAEAPKKESPKAEAPKAADDSKEKEEKRRVEGSFTLSAEDIEVLRDIPRISLRYWWKTQEGYSEFSNALLEYSSVKAASIIIEDIVGDPKFKTKMLELKGNMERDHKIFVHINKLIQASKKYNVSIDTIIEQLPASDAKKMKDFEGKIKFWLKFYEKEVLEQLGASAGSKPQAGSKQSGKPDDKPQQGKSQLGKPQQGNPKDVPPLKLGGLGDDPDLGLDKQKPGTKSKEQGFGGLGHDWAFEQALQISLSEKLGGASRNPDADFERAIALSMGKPDPAAAQAKPQGSAEYKAGAEAANLETKRRADKPKSGITADEGPVKPQAQKAQAQKAGQNGANQGNSGVKPVPSMIVPLTLEEQIKNKQEKVARLEKTIKAEEAMVENQFAAFQAVKAENEKGLKESFDQYEKRNALMRQKLEKADLDEKILKEIEAGTILESIESFSAKKQELIQSHIEAVLQYQQFVEEYNLAKQQAEQLKPAMQKLEKDFAQKRLEIERAKLELREEREGLKVLVDKKKQEDAEAVLFAKLGSRKPEAPKAADADKPVQGKPAQAEPSKAQAAAEKPEASKDKEPGVANIDNAKSEVAQSIATSEPKAPVVASAEQNAAVAAKPATVEAQALRIATKPQNSYAQQADFGPVNIAELHRKERDEQQERMRAQQRQQQERAREERERAAAEMDQKQRAEQQAKARREAGLARLEQAARGVPSNNSGFNSLTAYTSYSNLGANAAAAGAANAEHPAPQSAPAQQAEPARAAEAQKP